MNSAHSPQAARQQLTRALTIGALGALLIWTLRIVVVVILETKLREGDPAFTLWRLGRELTLLGGHAVLSGATLTLAVLAATRGGAAAIGTTLLAAAVCFSALAGWPWAEVDQIPGLVSMNGRIGVGGMALGSLALAFLAGLRGRRAIAGDFLAKPASTALALLALVALPIVFRVAFSSPREKTAGETLAVTRVVHELAFEDDLWEAVAYPPNGKPRAHVITPSLDYRLDGGDMPALTMPAPSEVRFTVPDDHGEVWLTGRTGVDLAGPLSLRGKLERVDIGFSIHVDGEQLWESRHRINRDKSLNKGLLWKDVEDLRLQPGQEVVLKSVVLHKDAEQEVPLIAMGFGSLVLEQRYEKPLMQATPDKPNVVLIVMDTLRQDRLSCYGYELETTPALDSLAERGILYENAYSTASWTWPATASILTGLHPETHGVLADGECYLNNSVETLAELLSARNYVTGAFTCNPLIVPNKNFDKGFDDFDSFHQFRHSSKIIADIRDWIQLNSPTRFFLYVQFTDTHEKYELTAEAVQRVGGTRPDDYPLGGLDEYHGNFLRGEAHDDAGNSDVEALLTPEIQDWMQHAYDAAVITADDFVGQVLDELHSLGLDENTIVAFTSDHGEEILDHGMLTHGHTLYPELTRVPLMLAGPGLPQGERVATPVSNRHLAPSLAALGNASFSVEQDPIDLKSPSAVRAQPIYFSTKQGWWNGKFRVDIYGVRDGDWELHWAPMGSAWGSKEPVDGGLYRLYHLAEDPTALTDVAAEHPTRASELLEQLRNHIGRAIEGKPKQTVGAGKRSHEALIGIGYIQTEEDDDEDEKSEGQQ